MITPVVTITANRSSFHKGQQDMLIEDNETGQALCEYTSVGMTVAKEVDDCRID